MKKKEWIELCLYVLVAMLAMGFCFLDAWRQDSEQAEKNQQPKTCDRAFDASMAGWRIYGTSGVSWERGVAGWRIYTESNNLTKGGK